MIKFSRKTISVVVTMVLTQISFSQAPDWMMPLPLSLPLWNPNINGPLGTGNSQPALERTTPWALGGNSMFGILQYQNQITNFLDPNYKSTSIGTVDDAPFILKANNREALFISPGGKVGLGWNNFNSGAAVDIWSDINAVGNRSRISFYTDKQGTIESDESMSLLFRQDPNSTFNIKEGSYSGSSQFRFTVRSGGLCGINNSAPTAALDVRSATNGASFRIYGDGLGNVEAQANMSLHYANGGIFQINRGTVANPTTGFLLNSFGAHIHTTGAFNGLFIGPANSTWYNNSASTRIWLDAVTNDALAIVCGNGNKAMFVANPAGAMRYEMKINTGGGDDTKFKLGGSAQFGFYTSLAAFEDNTTRVNVDAGSTDGVKITTNNNSRKAFFVDNSNFINNSFVVFADGRTRIGPGRPDIGGVAANASLTVDGMILARDIRVSISTGTHWADYVFDKDYKLMPLKELEKYIQKNNHLPDVPSEAEVKEQGIDLTAMNVALLKKVEELTLYLFELKKETETLKNQIQILKK